MTSNLKTVELTDDPEKQTALYMSLFNAGDADAVNQLYTDDAVSVWEPGNPLTGQARKDYLAGFLALGPTMNAKLRHSYITGDTTLLVVDWTIEVVESEGAAPTKYTGVGLDVLRLGDDGKWRYAVDNPFGEES